MAKSAGEAGLTVDGTVKSMMELQQKGGLISSKVLPIFAKNMSLAARANGGLEKAMLSNRVAMNRMMFSIQEAADIVFKSGFAKGLTEFFNTTASSVIELKPLWESLGEVLGSVFHMLAKGIKAVTPTLKAMGEVLKSIASSLGESYAWLLLMTSSATILFGIIKRIGGTGVFLARTLPWLGALFIALDAIKAMAFWAEELDNLLFSRNKRGVLYDAATGNSELWKGFNSLAGVTVKDSMTKGSIESLMSGTLDIFKTFWGQGIQNSLDFMGIKHDPQKAINITISADAEKMGITVAKSAAVSQTIDGKIQQAQQ